MKTVKTILVSALLMALLPSTGLAKTKKASSSLRQPADTAAESSSDNSDEAPLTLSEMQRQMRLQHAHELLGKYYKGSVVRSGEKVTKINKMIYHWAKERLPAKHRGEYQKVAQAIIDESLKHGFDPVFLMSVIQGESSFNPDMRGSLDELGLMQIRPGTGKWIARKYGLKWKGEKSLRDPVSNIRIGAAYLEYLRGRFDSHAQLYLAAYNMGQKSVDTALEKNVWPKDYPVHVMRLYVEFYSALGSSEIKKATKKS